jgi:hypothetical protein
MPLQFLLLSGGDFQGSSLAISCADALSASLEDRGQAFDRAKRSSATCWNAFKAVLNFFGQHLLPNRHR